MTINLSIRLHVFCKLLAILPPKKTQNIFKVKYNSETLDLVYTKPQCFLRGIPKKTHRGLEIC